MIVKLCATQSKRLRRWNSFGMNPSAYPVFCLCVVACKVILPVGACRGNPRRKSLQETGFSLPAVTAGKNVSNRLSEYIFRAVYFLPLELVRVRGCFFFCRPSAFPDRSSQLVVVATRGWRGSTLQGKQIWEGRSVERQKTHARRQSCEQTRERKETPCGPTIMPFQTVSVMSSPLARP